MPTDDEIVEVGKTWKSIVEAYESRNTKELVQNIDKLDNLIGEHIAERKIKRLVDPEISGERLHRLKTVFYYVEVVRRDRLLEMNNIYANPISAILAVAEEFFGEELYHFYEKRRE